MAAKNCFERAVSQVNFRSAALTVMRDVYFARSQKSNKESLRSLSVVLRNIRTGQFLVRAHASPCSLSIGPFIRVRCHALLWFAMCVFEHRGRRREGGGCEHYEEREGSQGCTSLGYAGWKIVV